MDGDPSCVFETLRRVLRDDLAMSNRRAGDVYGIPSEAPALPTAVLTLRRRSGASRSRARSSGRFRRLQSWTSTMRKLLTWSYVATDSANHGGELGKAPRTPEGRQIRARFPAKRPRTRGGHGTREERSPSGRQLATGGGIQTSGRTTGPSARSPLAPPLRQLILFPSGSIAIYWETAAALGLRER